MAGTFILRAIWKPRGSPVTIRSAASGAPMPVSRYRFCSLSIYNSAAGTKRVRSKRARRGACGSKLIEKVPNGNAHSPARRSMCTPSDAAGPRARARWKVPRRRAAADRTGSGDPRARSGKGRRTHRRRSRGCSTSQHCCRSPPTDPGPAAGAVTRRHRRVGGIMPPRPAPACAVAQPRPAWRHKYP